MKWYGRILEYVIYTAIMTFAYYPVVIPWLIFVGHMPIDRVEVYLWQGYLIDLGVAYPIGKLLVHLSPRIKQVTGFDLQLLWTTFRGVCRQRGKELWENLVSL